MVDFTSAVGNLHFFGFRACALAEIYSSLDESWSAGNSIQRCKNITNIYTLIKEAYARSLLHLIPTAEA